MTREEIIAGVREYALEHYEEGWDMVVECFEDEDIAELVAGCRTVNGAIRKMRPGIEAREAYRRDIAATAW